MRYVIRGTVPPGIENENRIPIVRSEPETFHLKSDALRTHCSVTRSRPRVKDDRNIIMVPC